MTNTILLVEDDLFLRDGITELLRNSGYTVIPASNKQQAENMLTSNKPELIVLDVMLPDGNGLDICRKLRVENILIPVLFLTACDDENEIVAGFEAGGDDYVTKPFGTKELLARIKSLLKRNNKIVYDFGNIHISSENMTVEKDGKNIYVTPTEFQILIRLIKNNGAIVTRSSLLENIWDNYGNFIDDNTLSVHISRLREKIGTKHIVTVRGIGYRWEAEI